MDWIGESFEWDAAKELANVIKHGVDFTAAQLAFDDPKRVITHDPAHSDNEPRFHCLGKVANGVLTVRFVMRGKRVRIIGAGYWRKGRKAYEEANQIHG
ncbi:MAG: BrnT family toxin [Phycisphaerales bacterium]|nr:BrnT family toxin [Phycisphaerales bacterium]